MFLRRYTPHVSLFTQQTCELHEQDRATLDRHGVGFEPRPVVQYDFSGAAVRLALHDGGWAEVDTLYLALGSQPNNELAQQLGIDLGNDNCVVTDRHQRLPLPGLYAAGDVVSALDQLSVATGHAAIAATAMHNDLRERDGETSRP